MTVRERSDRLKNIFDLFPEISTEGIYFVDIGCSGKLDHKWRGIIPLLNYSGFDPDQSEIARLNALPSRFKSRIFLPYAIAGQKGPAILHLTKSPFCSSLLRPRHEWLQRFTYHPLFREIGEKQINCTTLDDLATQENLKADILKIDSQGLEMPILQTSKALLKSAFCVETETGFTENYYGESIAADVDRFMRQNGFLLFDMQMFRQKRLNPKPPMGRQQPLWCECLWLKDYLAQQSWGINIPRPSRIEAIKALVICQSLDFIDYGYELTQYFHQQNLITTAEHKALSRRSFWRKSPKPLSGRVLRLIPRLFREWLHRAVENTL